jgi:hypothetical protein
MKKLFYYFCGVPDVLYTLNIKMSKHKVIKNVKINSSFAF